MNPPGEEELAIVREIIDDAAEIRAAAKQIATLETELKRAYGLDERHPTGPEEQGDLREGLYKRALSWNECLSIIALRGQKIQLRQKQLAEILISSRFPGAGAR